MRSESSIPNPPLSLTTNLSRSTVGRVLLLAPGPFFLGRSHSCRSTIKRPRIARLQPLTLPAPLLRFFSPPVLPSPQLLVLSSCRPCVPRADSGSTVVDTGSTVVGAGVIFGGNSDALEGRHDAGGFVAVERGNCLRRAYTGDRDLDRDRNRNRDVDRTRERFRGVVTADHGDGLRCGLVGERDRERLNKVER